jgi:hypothetical protein
MGGAEACSRGVSRAGSAAAAAAAEATSHIHMVPCMVHFPPPLAPNMSSFFLFLIKTTVPHTLLSPPPLLHQDNQHCCSLNSSTSPSKVQTAVGFDCFFSRYLLMPFSRPPPPQPTFPLKLSSRHSQMLPLHPCQISCVQSPKFSAEVEEFLRLFQGLATC